MKRNLLLNTFFIACLASPLYSISSVADRAFLENADQFQESEGVQSDSFYTYKLELESNAPYVQPDSSPVNQASRSSAIQNQYLPPLVKKEESAPKSKPSQSNKGSFGYSFSDMAKKTQKKETSDKKSFGFSFESLAETIQKTPTQNRGALLKETSSEK